ncbi:divergent polysaccharide deacetylase family protein [Actinobacillus equuli]|uniref:divergent polysaccharide deacetylase family protein n=1 Tax=Actinobacillus equuli TaxID=718 RepID=UPI0024436894|nr:divergent polysaccharide deacetylase family protein [Actinobacillus equuli]WGE47528.1 divergent polysaccharide deacetylase family protein [Actinobacillus equuli subsp. haemolyticus]WGE60041.1 divergent polysaccharide deacetylase family protein [Actinobacillus equuli subsp. haemolyticus]WGE61312.1 divergent polysaccharide deacetylase family protein [Actinobacillus equuli subsp. haemolyticus]WGE70511.1 divergent polysaccharide deacetylase family protein [Actinobacillus equuli subsp. haemolytic
MWNLFGNKRSILAIFLQSLLLITPLAHAGKLAIVIDDIGYRMKEDNAIYALPKEVSVAIIPVAPYATARAKKAYEQKRDVLIHLPMQPKNKQQPIESGALMIGASEAKVAQLIQAARNQVPYAIGLNNHMGSGATADRTTMSHLMKVMAQQQLFFLDSKTGPSVAAKVAKEFGVKALERNLFLDDSDVLSDVQRQFDAAIEYARKHGSAILIGHPRKNSVAVLEQGIANLPQDIQLVSMGSLWRNEAVVPASTLIMVFDNPPAPTSIAPFNAVPLLRGIPKD